MSLYKRKYRNKVENPSFSMGLQQETSSRSSLANRWSTNNFLTGYFIILGVMDMSEFLTVETDRIMNSFHNMAKTLPRVKSRNSRQTWLDHRKIKGLNNR